MRASPSSAPGWTTSVSGARVAPSCSPGSTGSRASESSTAESWMRPTGPV
jgi:hypothetical protein